MSTLQQNLQERRSDSATASLTVGSGQQAAIIVCIWQGATWVLPWAQFLYARLEGNRIELTFAGNIVSVTGHQLHGLLDDLAAFRIGCLRDLPVDYRNKTAKDASFISKIEVSSLSHRTSVG